MREITTAAQRRKYSQTVLTFRIRFVRRTTLDDCILVARKGGWMGREEEKEGMA